MPTLLGSGIRRILDLKIRVQQNQQNHRASRCKCSCGLSQIQGRPTCFSALAVLSISAVIKEHFNILCENIWTHSSWCANTTARKQKHGGSRSPVSVLIQAFRQRCDIWKEHSEQQENGLYYTAESQWWQKHYNKYCHQNKIKQPGGFKTDFYTTFITARVLWDAAQRSC